MATPYTPGPWEECEGKISAFSEKHQNVKLMMMSYHANGAFDAKTQIANARLAACAPELLDCLVNILNNHDALAMYERAENVIKKAGGSLSLNWGDR